MGSFSAKKVVNANSKCACLRRGLPPMRRSGPRCDFGVTFERGKLTGKFRIREEHLAQAHKCAHDGDVDLHGPRTPQDAGKHRDALFGKITAATATVR